MQRNDRYFIGCDPGQAIDPTAIAVVRRRETEDYKRPLFQVGHLERLPLQTPYPSVIRHIQLLLAKPPFDRDTDLVLDATGVGLPVADMFVAQGLNPVRVMITGGDTVTREKGIHRVPKSVLVSGVQALLHDGRLQVQKDIADAPILKSELQDFRATVNDQGYWKFGARVGKHDDLVLAVAIAVWKANGPPPMRISPESLNFAADPRYGRPRGFGFGGW